MADAIPVVQEATQPKAPAVAADILMAPVEVAEPTAPKALSKAELKALHDHKAAAEAAGKAAFIMGNAVRVDN